MSSLDVGEIETASPCGYKADVKVTAIEIMEGHGEEELEGE